MHSLPTFTRITYFLLTFSVSMIRYCTYTRGVANIRHVNGFNGFVLCVQ